MYVPRRRLAQIYSQALGSLSVVSYDSQGYGGGILSLLHTGNPPPSMEYTIFIMLTEQEVNQNHENKNVRYIGQGEALHRKYKRLKLGGGHVYDCSSD
jgi:hypothetical protein